MIAMYYMYVHVLYVTCVRTRVTYRRVLRSVLFGTISKSTKKGKKNPADGPLVTLSTEQSACQITSASQPDSERDANRPGVQAALYQRLFPRSNSYILK